MTRRLTLHRITRLIDFAMIPLSIGFIVTMVSALRTTEDGWFAALSPENKQIICLGLSAWLVMLVVTPLATKFARYLLRDPSAPYAAIDRFFTHLPSITHSQTRNSARGILD